MSEEPRDEQNVKTLRDESPEGRPKEGAEQAVTSEKTEKVINDAGPTSEAGTKDTESVSPPPVGGEAGVAVASESPAPARTPGGLLVLQWLSYAFWFLYGVSMSWLAVLVVKFFTTQNHSSEWSEESGLVYPLAAVIVMSISALAADWFYAKHEVAHKQGGAKIIMLLHAVPFVLMSIGSLIAMVFSLLMMMLGGSVGDSSESIRVLLVGLVMAIVYGSLAFRVVFGGRKAIIRRVIWVVLGTLALGFTVAAFVGPALETSRTKQDRLVESALSSIASDIRAYTRKNKKLPSSLNDLGGSGLSQSNADKQVIDKKLVDYKPNTHPASGGGWLNEGGPGLVDPLAGRSNNSKDQRFYYQLCTNYRSEKKARSSYVSGMKANYIKDAGVGTIADYWSDYIYGTASHPAGQVCYCMHADTSRSTSYQYDIND